MEEGLVDILCSDYHFPSLLGCALRMAENGLPLADAIRLVTLNPARHLRLDQSIGSIEVGKCADLVAFHPRKGFADVSHVWVNGLNQLSVSDAQAMPAARTLGASQEEALLAGR
jgi:alpha-D-ribose 1-methylphosphonate 5-triphosphate diphosphatase